MNGAASAIGLCADCVHARWVESQRSRFLRCGLSDSDPAFPRYPRLPVLECRGYRRRDAPRAADDRMPPP